MRVGLFDLHTGGHHVERGNKLLRELNRRGEDVTVDFVVPERTSQHDPFPRERIVSLPGFSPDSIEPETPSYRRKAVRAALDFFAGSEYDVVHLIEIDDILEPVYQYAPSRPALPPLLGRLDGGRFFRNTRRYRATTALAQHSIGSVGYRRLHRRFFGDEAKSDEVKRRLYELAEPAIRRAPTEVDVDRDAFDQLVYSLIKPAVLQNSLDRGVYDHVFVQTDSARTYLRSLSPAYAARSVSVVPDPVDNWLDELPGKTDARERLGIDPVGPVLLTFGELRREKGIDVLLDALERYEGPAFTMVVVGKPVDVSGSQIRAAKTRIDVPIHEVLEFVPEEDVPLYFAAADGVVVPYRPSFGKQRTSGPFQKACATARPVLAPEFGMFEKRVAEWDLGLTFEPNSPTDLARTLRTLVADPNGAHDSASAKRYARSQSYESLADDVLAMYQTLA